MGKALPWCLTRSADPYFEEGLKCLAQRGRQIAITSLGDPRVALNLVDFYHKESTLVGVDSLKLSFAECGDILRQLVPLIEAGKITPPLVEEVSPDKAIQAYEKVLAASTREKQVILFLKLPQQKPISPLPGWEILFNPQIF